MGAGSAYCDRFVRFWEKMNYKHTAGCKRTLQRMKIIQLLVVVYLWIGNLQIIMHPEPCKLHANPPTTLLISLKLLRDRSIDRIIKRTWRETRKERVCQGGSNYVIK